MSIKLVKCFFNAICNKSISFKFVKEITGDPHAFEDKKEFCEKLNEVLKNGRLKIVTDSRWPGTELVSYKQSELCDYLGEPCDAPTKWQDLLIYAKDIEFTLLDKNDDVISKLIIVCKKKCGFWPNTDCGDNWWEYDDTYGIKSTIKVTQKGCSKCGTGLSWMMNKESYSYAITELSDLFKDFSLLCEECRYCDLCDKGIFRFSKGICRKTKIILLLKLRLPDTFGTLYRDLVRYIAKFL